MNISILLASDTSQHFTIHNTILTLVTFRIGKIPNKDFNRAVQIPSPYLIEEPEIFFPPEINRHRSLVL